MINILLGNKRFKVKEAKSNEDMQRGLQNVKELPKDEGMIFYWDEPQRVDMWMRDTKIPLDIIYINSDQEVIDVKQGIPDDDTLLSVEDTMYVVELNKDSGVKVGDELEFENDFTSEYVMDVLGPDGNSQYQLKGGERIVSRRQTKIIIRKAKKALDSQAERDFKSLGKYIFKVFDQQDKRDPEYVNLPDA